MPNLDELRRTRPAPAARTSSAAAALQDHALVHEVVKRYLGFGRDIPGKYLDDELLLEIWRVIKMCHFDIERAAEIFRTHAGGSLRALARAARKNILALEAVPWAA